MNDKGWLYYVVWLGDGRMGSISLVATGRVTDNLIGEWGKFIRDYKGLSEIPTIANFILLEEPNGE